MSYQTHQIEWQGIKLHISYSPVKLGNVSHIEVRSILPCKAPLPITGTGYRSHFVPIGTVEAEFNNVVDYVLAWLDEYAKTQEWQKQKEKSAQGELF